MKKNIFTIILLCEGMIIISQELPPIHRIYSSISLFQLGRDISYLKIPRTGHNVFVTGNQAYQYFILISDDIAYEIAYSENYIVKAIIISNDTYSKKIFKTPEGIFVGMTYKDLIKKLKDVKLTRRTIGYTFKLKSGWEIVFGYLPNPDDKISMIYKK